MVGMVGVAMVEAWYCGGEGAEEASFSVIALPWEDADDDDGDMVKGKGS